MRVSKRPLTVTRDEAAIRQIEAAIAALEHGHLDIAITLSAAAEGMFESRKDGTMREWLITHPRALEHFDRKEWNRILNAERDWLKHDGDKPDTITIDVDTAAFMIMRACTKMKRWTARMDRFGEWLARRVNRSPRPSA